MKYENYEAVIGLEVHAELKTESKIFCACSTSFGAAPNTHCCPVCMGLPGTLPTLNRRAVELAVMAGLVLHCDIARISRTDRKQYFYPDLPKAYQISQAGVPLCRNGFLEITLGANTHRVGISRIHIEEDAGKLIHTGNATLVDYNRCGIGLIEIVSEPCMRSGAEAAAYLRKLRSLLSAAGISDCKMQEGSLRCDVNISVRPKGTQALGVRTEIKNLNSFAFMEKAIAYEFERHCALLEKGEAVTMETRRFDPATAKTYPMRTKERVFDYRFLIEPDLFPISVTDADIQRLEARIPELPDACVKRLISCWGISRADAEILVGDGELLRYFEAVANQTTAPVIALHLILTELLRLSDSESFSTPILPLRISQLADLLGARVINSSTAKKMLLRLTEGDLDPLTVVKQEGLEQLCDPAMLMPIVEQVLAENPRAVTDYRNGKTAAMRALQGKAMAATAGRADPVLLEHLLTEQLKAKEGEGNT